MATKTIQLNSYTSCTVTYEAIDEGTQIFVSMQSVSWKNTRSAGLPQASDWSVGSGNASSADINVSGRAAKGSKTWSKNVPYIDSAIEYYEKTRSTSTKTISLYASLEYSDGIYEKTAPITITVPALPSYTVSYNANGGNNAPSAQTKWYDQASITLTSDIPTREGYEFVNWNTQADGSGMYYSSGASYNNDANVVLYAQWKPVVSGILLNVSTLRVASGQAVAEADDGTWCYGTCDYTVSGAAAGALTLTVSVSPSGPSIQTSTFTDSKLAGEPLTGSIVFRASGCSVNDKYLFEVTASCTNSSATQTAVTKTIGDWLSPAYFPLDILGDAYLYNLTEDATPSSSKTYYTRTGDGSEDNPFVYTEMPSSQQSFETGVDYYEANGPRPGHGIAFGLPATMEGVTVADRFRHLALDIERDVVPASSIYPGGLAVSDKNGVQIGYFQAVQLTDGNEGVQLGTGRNVNNSDIWHTLQMCINANGTANVTFSHLSAWRNALGIGTAITASVNAELTLSTSYQKVRLANKVSTSSGLSIASYGVKCERAGYVLASAQVYFSGVNDQNVCNARILKNADMMARAQTRSSGERVELAVSPTLIQVSPNDIIYL